MQIRFCFKIVEMHDQCVEDGHCHLLTLMEHKIKLIRARETDEKLKFYAIKIFWKFFTFEQLS